MDISAILASHALWLSSAHQEGTRADLTRADLTGADLTCADLTRANLTGATIRPGLTLGRNIGQATRGDSYVFNAFETDSGELFFFAGCRSFLHSEFDSHIAANYPSSDKARATIACLDYLAALRPL